MWSNVKGKVGVNMSIIPYGYRIINETAFIDEKEAEILKTLFKEYIKCGSMLASARKAGINMTHSKVGLILKNNIYLGSDFYPRIIDDDTFKKAQETRFKTAQRLGRIKECGLKEKPSFNLDFSISAVERKYEDPYKQASYAYEMIKEKETCKTM